MRLLRWGAGCAALATALASAPACGQSAAELVERLQRADTASAIDTVGRMPWHMKMSVQLYDAKGAVAEQGLIEAWWAGPRLSRVVYALPSYRATELVTEAGFFRTRGVAAGPAPMMLELLLAQVEHPMPSANEVEHATPELRRQRFGKAALECVMLDQPIAHRTVEASRTVELPLGLFPTYCMDAGTDALRATYDYGQQLILRNDVADFDGRAVAREIAISRAGSAVASGRVFKLEKLSADAAGFEPDATLEAAGERAVLVGAGTMAGALLTKVNPMYPKDARQHEIAGEVILQAEIGSDGRVRFLRALASREADLSGAAMAAVRQWTYTPYVVDGRAVDVDTTVVVNFHP
jgi:TonB family protein